MSTRAYLALLLAVALRGPLVAQPWIDFLKQPVLAEDERRSMMYSYVDAHLPPIELPSTKRAWEQRKAQLRTEILRLVGLPELDRRTPVRFLSKGFIERDTYTIEKILFESYPGMMVPGLVYAPKRIPSLAPAMISIPGHVYCEGKASESVQARCINLASRGIIAMTFDYIGTGERNTGANACGAMPYGGGNEHGLRTFSYTAGNPTGLDILDGIRAVDYLRTRKDVDPERIGFTGESGGSNTTYWVSALDERVKLAVPVCSVTTFDYWIRNNRNWDWHQRPPGIRRVAEISTLLAMIAPRPLLVIGSLRGTDAEEFPFDQTEEAVAGARRVYKLYGAEDNTEIWESNTNHGYQRDKRERMYSFVEKHFLKQEHAQSKESAFLLEPIPELLCGLPPDNKTLDKIYTEWLRRATPGPELPNGREAAERIQSALRGELSQVLGIASKSCQPRISVQAVTSRGDFLLRRLIIETEPGIRLPIVEIIPRTKQRGATVLVLNKSGPPPRGIGPLLSAGLSVALTDLRGTGEIDSGGSRTDNWAWFMGQTWPGMWAFDISAVANAFAAENPSRQIGVLGTGGFATAALFAAAMCPRIQAAVIELDAATYRTRSATSELSDVPRILAYMDLPVVAAMVAPRRLYIAHAPDNGQAFQHAYEWPQQFFRRGFDADALELHAAPSDSWAEFAAWFAKNMGQPQ